MDFGDRGPHSARWGRVRSTRNRILLGQMSGTEQSCEPTIFPGYVASVIQVGNVEGVASVSTFAGRGAEAILNGLCDCPEDTELLPRVQCIDFHVVLQRQIPMTLCLLRRMVPLSPVVEVSSWMRLPT